MNHQVENESIGSETTHISRTQGAGKLSFGAHLLDGYPENGRLHGETDDKNHGKNMSYPSIFFRQIHLTSFKYEEFRSDPFIGTDFLRQRHTFWYLGSFRSIYIATFQFHGRSHHQQVTLTITKH